MNHSPIYYRTVIELGLFETSHRWDNQDLADAIALYCAGIILVLEALECDA